MNLKKSILKVFSVNFLQLISSLIIGFIIPEILSLDDYANLKTYTLYVSYIGLFHLGFLDGLYIKYGGKKINDINKGELKSEHNFLIIFQLIISIILCLISILLKNVVLTLFSISILPIMIQAFHKYIFQATGEFNSYSKIMNIYTIVYTILNVILALIFKNKDYVLYCLTTFIANFVSVIVFEYKFLKKYKEKDCRIDKNNILKNIKVGFFVLLGNLSVVGLFGIDKWFVKLFLSTEDFAYYSFAVSMLNLVNVLVNAISITFYNYLFSNNSAEKINKIKRYLIILGGFASLGYFALSFIVTNFIKKYIPSLDIIAITFSIFPYMILINALYVNLYKINKNEKHYFKVVISMLIISIIYNIIAVNIFNNTIAIAFATILTLATWVIYSTIDIDKVKFDKIELVYFLLITGIFLFSAHFFNWWIGGVIYMCSYILITFITNKNLLVEIKKLIIDMKKVKKKS